MVDVVVLCADRGVVSTDYRCRQRTRTLQNGNRWMDGWMDGHKTHQITSSLSCGSMSVCGRPHSKRPSARKSSASSRYQHTHNHTQTSSNAPLCAVLFCSPVCVELFGVFRESASAHSGHVGVRVIRQEDGHHRTRPPHPTRLHHIGNHAPCPCDSHAHTHTRTERDIEVCVWQCVWLCVCVCVLGRSQVVGSGCRAAHAVERAAGRLGGRQIAILTIHCQYFCTPTHT